MRATQTKQVTVTGALSISISAPSKGYSGISITASASWSGSDGPFDGVIHWGDGSYSMINTTSKSTSKTHIYSSTGIYTISVEIVDRYTDARGTNTTSIQIAAKLSATLYPSPSSGDAPLPVSFSIGIGGGYPSYTWVLNPGDGSTSYVGSRTTTGTFTLAHTYSTVGTYSATLTVTDALGTSTVTRTAILAGIISWWDALKAWWNGLAGWQKALIVATSAGGVIIGGATALKKS